MDNIINIGTRREVFWDDTILNTEETGTAFQMHEPVRRECIYTIDGPWAADDCEYISMINDNGLYRMYIHAARTKYYTNSQKPVGEILYIESRDGIHWEAPNLGTCNYEGSTDNNLLFEIFDESSPYYDKGFDGFKVTIDTNPNCPPEERYKAVANKRDNLENRDALQFYTSPDGIHFTKKGFLKIYSQFDSVNTLLYDNTTNKYRVFYRGYHPSPSPEDGRWFRDIRMAESDDLINWEQDILLRYDDYVDWQLYTNGIEKYYRAPHIYVGFPVRYVERPTWQDNYEELCGAQARKERTGRYATAITDSLFMTSRDGINWKRYNDAFFIPGPEHPTNWVYGSAYLVNGMAETPSIHPGCDNEISLYSAEHRWFTKPAEIYRYTLRLDGFVSQFAPWHGTQLVTKPFIYEGKELYINFATSSYGYMKITLKAIDGSDSISTGEIFGDSTNQHVRFVGDKTPADLAGKPVVMTIQMRDAHMYSFKFE